MSLPSCIQVEILVFSVCTSGSWPPSLISINSDVGQYSNKSHSVAWPLKHGYSRWNLVAVRYTSKDMGVINILPVHGRHFEFRLQFSSAVITVISGNSAALKNKDRSLYRLPLVIYTSWYDDAFFIQKLIQKTYTDICYRGRHRVTAENLLMGKPPKCADWVPREVSRSASWNSYGNRS